MLVENTAPKELSLASQTFKGNHRQYLVQLQSTFGRIALNFFLSHFFLEVFLPWSISKNWRVTIATNTVSLKNSWHWSCYSD